MKSSIYILILLLCNLHAGGPIVLVDNESITNETKYLLPLGSKKGLNRLLIVVKASSHKPKGANRTTNHPLKIESIKFHLDGKELMFDSVKKLPLLEGSIKDSIILDSISNDIVKIQFNKVRSTHSVYISSKGGVMLIDNTKTQNKSQ